MDNCNIRFHEVDKVQDIISELENNDVVRCYRLSKLIKSESFLQFCENDKVAKSRDLANINKNTLRRLIKSYRNLHIFNVNNTAVNNPNAGMYGFKNQIVLEDSIQFTADLIAANYFKHVLKGDKGIKINTVLKEVREEITNKLMNYASKYKGEKVTDIDEAYSIVENKGTEQEKNFKDYVFISHGNIDFIEAVFRNSKISSLGRNIDFEDEEFKNLILADDEEHINDTEQSSEIDLSTKQWSIDSLINNFTGYVSDEVRMYFDSLPKMNSTSVNKDGTYDEDLSSSIGCPKFHTYQECSIEIAGIINARGGFKSMEHFIKAIKELAENKKEFAAFIKVANDITNNPDLGYRISSDLNRFVIDKLEVTIDSSGTIQSVQSNTSNNPMRKLYFNFINDLRGTCIQNNNVDIEKELETINTTLNSILSGPTKVSKLKSASRGNTSEKAIAENNMLLDEVMLQIVDIYKAYFPSIDPLAIYSYVEKNVPTVSVKNVRAHNVSVLVSNLKSIIFIAKNSVAEKERRDFEQRKIYSENIKRKKEYELAKQFDSKIGPLKLLQYNTYTDDYLIGADKTVADIAKYLEPYTYSKAELNSRSVAGTLNSDLIPNSFITNLAKICSDRELLNNWVKEKLKSTEYDYSNILIDRSAEGGNYGLFIKQPNGDYKLTDYAHTIIAPYLINGVSNQENSTNADYTNMSDGDYFLMGLYAFSNTLKTYRFYNIGTASESIDTFPMIMRVPSDAPKNFAVTMPKYSTSGLWENSKELQNYIKEKVSRIVSTDYIGSYNKESIDVIKGVFSTNITDYESMADIIVNHPDSVDFNEYKNTYSKSISNLQRPDNGEPVLLMYKYVEDSIVHYYYFEGKYSEKNKKIIDIKYAGQERYNRNSKKDDADIKQLSDAIRDKIRTNGVEQLNSDAVVINTNNPVFKMFKNIIKGELFDYYKALVDIDNNDEEHLIEWFHYVPKKGIRDKNGKPTGNAFKFTKLDSKVGYDVNAAMQELIEQYGYDATSPSPTGDIKLLHYGPNNVDNAILDIRYNVELLIDKIVANWLNAYNNYILKEIHYKFDSFIGKIPDDIILSYAINSYLAYNNFDDLFEGNSKYYKNPQTFLKRAKECQAGGMSYGITSYIDINNNNPFTQSVRDVQGLNLTNNDKVLTFPDGRPVTVRTGWNAVTIKNSIRPSSNADGIYNKLIQAGVDKNKAEELAKPFGYIPKQINEKGELEVLDSNYKAETTTVNDAQSYITIYEAARRLKVLGKYNQYAELIEQLTDETTDIKDINPNKLQGFIQVMKNFYYDHYYNKRFGRHLPRQIKNAEFVLIPKFLKGTSLGILADYMIENDIDQINTQETSKAANYDVLTFWDNNGVLTEDNLKVFKEKAIKVKQPFSYMYLYKQQDVPQHMTDAKNKAGIQVMKKVIDNIKGHLSEHKNNFLEAYIANIKEDFNTLMDDYGIKFDENYNIIGGKEGVDYSKIYKMALVEASRLGLDSNTLDYLVINEGKDSPVMPNYYNIVSSKIESIAQSQFNKFITRQKLPGWHAAQVTSVGLENLIKDYKRLKSNETIETDEGKRIELKYNEETGVAEVLLPKWTKSMFNIYNNDGNLKYEINIEDVDEEVLKCIGYRIPTEGKQSMAILKIVGFLPEYMGSTIIVPDEWVTQTGSDFDVDSIYGISHEVYVDNNGKVHKIEYNDKDTEEDAYNRYVHYVISNSDGEHISKKNAKLTLKERTEITKKYREQLEESNQILTESIKDEIIELINLPNTYKDIPEEIRIKYIDKILKSKTTYRNRVYTLKSYSKSLRKKYNNEALHSFLDRYDEIYTKLVNQETLIDKINEEVNNLSINEIKFISGDRYKTLIAERAKSFGLMTFDEFKKLPIVEQNSRKARNNRIVDSMIGIMNDPSSLEENLARSNFDDIVEAIKAVDKLDESNSVGPNVNNILDQIQFHRNAMGGAMLKAFSVARDTGCSIFGVSQAQLLHPIKVIYGDRVNLNLASKAFNTEKSIYGNEIVLHDRIGNSKNDNKNVMGNYITVASSHTTAHILDAIKEGAIKNENEYTFAAFKTLFDIGCDAYTAILWLRQPGITRIVEAYYESQSVFIDGNFNPIHTAIKRIAMELDIKIKDKPVNMHTSINDIMTVLNSTYGKEFAKIFPGSTISFENNHNAYVNIIDVKGIEERYAAERTGNYDETTLLIDLGAILNFDYINNISKIIADHVRVINPDKFGAKQSIYNTRKVITDIGKILNSDKKDYIHVNGVPLLEAIYPNISKAFSPNGVNYKEYLKGDNKNSVYPTLDAFLRYSTIPSIMINQGLFETESDDFVKAIEGISKYLNGTITEDIYNDFKKYVLEYIYKTKSDVIKNPIKLNTDGVIINDIDAMFNMENNGLSPVKEEEKRIYGYNYPIDYEFEHDNINNPTAEEIEQFLKLTPAQKVHFVQQHLVTGERTIFDNINVNMFNAREYRTKKVNRQRLVFNDQNLNMEIIYRMFDAAFNNTNPLIRLTAIDIIKYAFVVEGYQFKRTNISKVIKNNALYTSLEDYGTGIVDSHRGAVGRITYNSLMINKLYEDYIRSHSDIKYIRTYNVKYDKKGPDIYPLKHGAGMYYFSMSNGGDVIKATKMGIIKDKTDNSGKVYRTISDRYIRINNKGVTSLYKISPDYGVNNDIIDIYLIPLIPLETNEHGEFSSNPVNNGNRLPLRYYNELIKISKDTGFNFESLAKSTNEEYSKLFTEKYKQSQRNKVTTNKIITENVPDNPNAIIGALYESKNPAPIKAFVDKINEGFANSNVKSLWVWNGSITLENMFKDLGVSSLQFIPDGKGGHKEYLISRVKINPKSKHLNDTQIEAIRQARDNNITSTDQMYMIVPRLEDTTVEITAEEDNNNVVNYSSIEMSLDNEVSNLGNLAQQFIIDIKNRKEANSDESATMIYNDLIGTGLEDSSIIAIEERKLETIKKASEYYVTKAHEIQRKLDNFIIDKEGIPHSVVDDYTIEKIKEDVNLRYEYINLILQASTFGNSFPLINEIATDNLDTNTKRNINTIRDTISNLKNNIILKQAFNVVVEKIYKPLSTNPNFENELSDISDYIFKDASYLDSLFQDTQELSYPLIQIILKHAKAKVDELMFEGDEYVKEYKTKINEIISEAEKAGQPINWNNIIDPNTGAFILNHTNEFITDKTKIEEELHDIKNKYGEYSKEYVLAKYKRDVWFANNVHRRYVQKYYIDELNAVKPMLEPEVIDFYIEYLKIKDERNKLLRIPKSSRTTKDIEKINSLNGAIRRMISDIDFDTNEYKIGYDELRASSLKAFIEAKTEIKKKYFTSDERIGFNEDLKHYLSIIEKYKHYDSMGRQIESEDTLLQISEYADAVEWLYENTIYRISNELRDKVKESFDKIRNGNSKNFDRQFKSIVSVVSDAYDNNGIIDGTKFNDTQVEVIKQEQENRFNNESNGLGSGETRIIRNRPPSNIIFSKTFYDKFVDKNDNNSIYLNAKNKIVKQINDIMIKAVDPNSGKIKLSDLSIDDIRELSDLYTKLYNIKRNNRKSPKVKKFIEEKVQFNVDEVTYRLDEDGAKSKGTEYYNAWKTIANNRKYDLLGDVEEFEDAPNVEIYGYITPKLDKDGIPINKDYYDADKTKAFAFINKNVRFVPTKYYHEARRKAIEENKLAEFEEKNLIFNPITGKKEPIRIWTTIEIIDETNNTKNYYPSYNNTRSKPLYTNDDYNKHTPNYNSRTGEYNNKNVGSKYEQELKDYMYKTMLSLTADNNKSISFTSHGLFPRRRRVESNFTNAIKTSINALGFGQSLDPDRHISDEIGYEFDKEVNIPMLSTLKDKTYKKKQPIPERGLNESDEDYNKRVEEVNKNNKKIDKYNKELDINLMDKDYLSVFEEFVKSAIQANTKSQTKLDLYFLLEYIRTQAEAHRITGFNNLAVDRKFSTEDRKMYKKVSADNSIKMVETWCKRFLFDEYKGKNVLDGIAAFGQNVASAKYMMMNITGGIGNILTGSTNIFMERFAGEYFNHSDWENAKLNYVKNIPSFIINMNKDTSDNIEDAIIKLMGVVDYNGIRETARTVDSIEIINKMKNFAYSPQSAGEHFMQNTAMFAMMNSNRIYKRNGKYVIGDFNGYKRYVEKLAMEDVLKDNKELLELYNKFVNRIKSDKNVLKDYVWFSKDINQDFLRSIGDKSYGFKYNEIRQKYLDKAKEEFESNPKLVDQFELVNGYAVLKKDSNITLKELALFKGKVVSVNKKIHGVYDKLGGARIESSWVFGSLAMQYHKHLYMGAMKRFRVNGYYNESRESIERGYYISLWNFATTEFTGINKRIKENSAEKDTYKFVAAVQEICRSFCDTFMNYKFNYATMSETEKANMRRALGELTGITYGLLLGIASSCILVNSDDDDGTAKFIANLALYQADRLSSETIAYNMGIISEFDKLWSSPLAIMSSIKDLGSALGFITKYITEGDEFNPYYTTGRYKGENKLAVYIGRQIPIYRNIKRISQLDQNNKYYKLTENMLGIVPIERIAEWVTFKD